MLDLAREGEGVRVVTLTDEELMALDGVEAPQVVALPWLNAQTADRTALCDVALRSLLARGLLSATVTTLTTVNPDDDTADVLSLYAHPDGVTVIQGAGLESVTMQDLGPDGLRRLVASRLR